MTEEEREKAQRVVEASRRPSDSNSSRKHHFIPQFHLRRFAGKDGRLLVIPADTSKPERLAKPANIAVIKDFYTTFEPDIGETVGVEDILSYIEGAASAAVERAAYGVLFPPQLRDRQALAMWVALQYVRGPDIRRALEALTDYLMKVPLSGIKTEEQARAGLIERGVEDPSEAEVRFLLEHCEQIERLEFVAPQNNRVKHMLDAAGDIAFDLANRHVAIVKFDRPGLMLASRPVVLIQENPRRVKGGWNLRSRPSRDRSRSPDRSCLPLR